MSESGNGPIATTRANLLLKLNDRRKLDAERLAKHEYRALLADLDAEGLLFPTSRDQELGLHGFRHPDPKIYNAMHAGFPALSIPLGSIATSDQPADLPGVGLLIKEAPPHILTRALINFLGEHHRKPFCRPLFLVERFDILPFFRRFEFAAYAERSGWNDVSLSMVKQRHDLDQIRDLITGAKIR